MKSSDCEECKHSQLVTRWHGVKQLDDLQCNKGHKPRFYHPKSPIDTNWGYRRICEDFEND